MNVPEPVQVDEWRWRLPRRGRMRTAGMIYATARLMEQIRQDNAIAQVANVACLPGILGEASAMPDIHWGYGFPIGGVAAFDEEEGIVSPGGVGYDINCGVRLLGTSLSRPDLEALGKKLLDGLFRSIPAGVGSSRKDLRLDREECRRVVTEGASWAVSRGFGKPDDVEFTEERGCIRGADFGAVSGSRSMPRRSASRRSARS